MQHETVKEKDNVVLNNKLDLTFWSEDKGRYACLNTIKQRLREQLNSLEFGILKKKISMSVLMHEMVILKCNKSISAVRCISGESQLRLVSC